MNTALNELNKMLNDELSHLSAAFCRESIYDSPSFNSTCQHTFVLRMWCETHDRWHVIPAKNRKPWRLVAEAESFCLEYLGVDGTPSDAAQELLAQARRKNRAYFEFMEQLERNTLDARREQKRLKARNERSTRKPPLVAAEFVPRGALVEFATCYRKVQYTTYADAQAAIELLHRNEMTKMNVYNCKFCKQRHIGHRPTRKPSPGTVYKHAKKFWRDYPREADRFAAERGLLLG